MSPKPICVQERLDWDPLSEAPDGTFPEREQLVTAQFLAGFNAVEHHLEVSSCSGGNILRYEALRQGAVFNDFFPISPGQQLCDLISSMLQKRYKDCRFGGQTRLILTLHSVTTSVGNPRAGHPSRNADQLLRSAKPSIGRKERSGADTNPQDCQPFPLCFPVCRLEGLRLRNGGNDLRRVTHAAS